MLALGMSWSVFFWRHTPARHRWQGQEDRPAKTLVNTFQGSARRATLAARSVFGDLLLGVGTLALLWVGTRVYVRRVEVWLEARRSGEAMSFGGTDLGAATIAANDERGGVLR